MRHETIDVRKKGVRRETIDASHVSRLSSPLVSRLTSHVRSAPAAAWPKVKLGEVADLDLGKMLDQKKNKGIKRKYLANIDVRWGAFNLDGIKEMPFMDSELERYGLKFGDIVMCEGGEPGRCAIWKEQMPGMMYQKALHRIRPHKGLDYRFLYYHFLLLGRKNGFAGLFTGSTIKHMPKDKLALVEIPIPPLPVQRRIADILSAYDDLIENNRRRIAILEETARLAYRKWFGGEVGRTLPLAEVADVLYGKDHKKIPDGDIPIFGSGGIMRYGAKAIYEQPSVLIPRKGTISNVMYVEEPFWTVDTMFYTRVKIPNMERILYYQLCDYNIASMSTGAAVPSMTTAILNALQIVVPPSELRQRFDKAVSPMFEQCRILKKQSAALAAARDMLLSRLMKGEVA